MLSSNAKVAQANLALSQQASNEKAQGISLAAVNRHPDLMNADSARNPSFKESVSMPNLASVSSPEVLNNKQKINLELNQDIQANMP